MKRGEGRRVAIILHSGEYERIHHAFSIALAAVANGFECNIFVAYDALVKLTKSRVDEIPPDTPFRRPLKRLIQEAKEGGALNLYACGSTLTLMGIGRSELIDEFDEVAGLSAFLTSSEGSEFTFFI